MTATPAERYAQARRRAARARTALHTFAEGFDFPLDDFQLAACQALEEGRGVLVAAPTGAGKTVVGEFAVHLALDQGVKCFYTTPIKALSNQKFHDLVERHGSHNVGLLTGDNSINGEAPIVVMTTEVLRNMLYAGSTTLTDLRYVVMDEVHYLADRFRGAVWEEVIIHLPESVRVAALSATVSNAEEFGEWLATVRGQTDVVVSEQRPVPLWQYVLTNERLHDLFVDNEQTVVNPELVRLARDESSDRRYGDRRPARGNRRPRSRREPSRFDEIERLQREDLLPVIVFIFSRAGCDAAVEQLARAGLRLTTSSERQQIEAIVDERTASIPDDDLDVLGWAQWRDALGRGVAAHHAGMLPTFKEVVEELFTAGLIKVVFATETLALGINMPARTVLLERLVKWNGDAHVDVTPGEYTQLTGRAGRRGIDVEGHAVVAWHQGIDPRSLAGLASTRTYPLNSSFKPSYNMAVNLVAQFGATTARELLETSFAQFQADKAVVGIARQQQRHQRDLQTYAEKMSCHLGDFIEYSGLRRALSDREATLARTGAAQRKAQAAQQLESLRPGDIIVLGSGRRSTPAVVTDSGRSPRFDSIRPEVLTVDRQSKRLSVTDATGSLEPIGRIRLPKGFTMRNSQMRRALATQLRESVPEDIRSRRRPKHADVDDSEVLRLRRLLKQHPCHGCDEREDHARWAERYWRLEREVKALDRRVEERTNSIGRTFDRVCSLLRSLDYLDGERITEKGRRLGRIYSELDLLASECLAQGYWDDLGPADLAACVSALVFESRQPDDAAAPRLPTAASSDALADMVRAWGRLEGLERDHGLSFLREPDLGFAWAAHEWASGKRLEPILLTADLTPGDFVRWVKQVVDLLGQISTAASQDSSVGRNADHAITQLVRGVVAYSSIR